MLGPVLVNYIRQYQIDSGVPKAQAYNVTMYIMAALLVVGFIANFLIKAVDDRHHMEIETVDDARRRGLREADMSFDNNSGGGTTPLQLALAWGFVGIPLLWGVYGTLVNAMKLFQ